MKNITRLSLALLMFSLFSISYLLTSAFAQEGAVGIPTTGDPCMVVPAGPDRDACYATTPPPTGMAPTGTPEMPATGDPCMVVPAGPDRDACYATTPPPTGMAPTGTPEMPATGMAPKETSESVGISGWIKGGLKALGIGSGPKVGDISHCAEFSGPPKSACEAAAAGN
jgi:hypothetical protein